MDSIELLQGDEGSPAGRRRRIALGAWRWLADHDLSRYDLIEFYGAEFALATWRLARRRNRPLLVAHTDGLELPAGERLQPFQVVEGGFKLDFGHFPGRFLLENGLRNGVFACGCENTMFKNSPPLWLKYLRALGKAGLQIGQSRVKSIARNWLADIKSRLEKKAFTDVDGFVTASGADVEYLRRQGLREAATMEVVLLGLDPAYFDLPWRNPREERVIFLGTWLNRKGVKSVARVMSALLLERRALVFDICGGDRAPEEAVLRNFPEEVRDRVSVTPIASTLEIIAAFSRAKVFFPPSEYEGFGLATAEAMASGCAVVTTPTGLEPILAPEWKGAFALSATRWR